MTGRRGSIARLMALVAVVAFDCLVVRWMLTDANVFGGPYGLALAASAGGLGFGLARGRLRTFFGGFLATLAGTLAILWAFWAVRREDVLGLYGHFTVWLLVRMPPSWKNFEVVTLPSGTSYTSVSTAYKVAHEVGITLPFLALAVIGGVAVLLIRPRREVPAAGRAG